MADFVLSEYKQEIILAMAEENMVVDRVAKRIYRNKNCVYYQLGKLKS